MELCTDDDTEMPGKRGRRTALSGSALDIWGVDALLGYIFWNKGILFACTAKKARVGVLKARVGRLKARVDAIKSRVT